MIQRPRKGNPQRSSHACIPLDVREECSAKDLSNVRPDPNLKNDSRDLAGIEWEILCVVVLSLLGLEFLLS